MTSFPDIDWSELLNMACDAELGQRAQQIISELETKILALEAKIVTLESKIKFQESLLSRRREEREDEKYAPYPNPKKDTPCPRMDR